MCGGKVLLLLSLLMALEHSHSAPTATDTDAVAPQEDLVDNNAESSGSEPSRHSAVMDYSNEPARYHDDPKLTGEEMWDDSTKVREEKRQTEYWDDPETVKPDAVESTTTAFNATEIADTSTNQIVFNAVETNDTSINTNQSAIENEETSDQPDFTTYSNGTVEEAQFTNTTETVSDSTTVTTTTGHEASAAIPKETETESEEEFREMKVELQETRNSHWHQHEQIFQDQTLKIVDMFRRFLQKQFKW